MAGSFETDYFRILDFPLPKEDFEAVVPSAN